MSRDPGQTTPGEKPASTLASTDSRPVGMREAARESIKESSDPRAARTREAIIAAMHELTAAGEATLTVSTLVKRAGISRSSFYAQFASLDALALAVLRDALAEIAAAGAALRASSAVSEPAAVRSGIARLVAHVDDNRVLYTSVLDLPVSNREAVTAFEAELRAAIPRVPNRDGHVAHDVTAAYIAGGTIAVLSGWLHTTSARTREDVTDQLLALLPSWIAAPPARQLDHSNEPADRQ